MPSTKTQIRLEPASQPASQPTSQSASYPQRPKPTLLTLPLEIRLEIYRHLLHLHPLERPDLAPGYPAPKPSPYLTTPVYLPPSSSFRPQGVIPTPLLLSCRQLSRETSHLPFHENEFIFPIFFTSGLTMAHAFLRRLSKLSNHGLCLANEMRYVRLAVHVIDFLSSERLHLWEELCATHWSTGLRGLRLSLTAGGQPDDHDARRKWWCNRQEDLLIQNFGRAVWGCPALDLRAATTTSPASGGKMKPPPAAWRWVDSGLKNLTGLRRLEVELAGGLFNTLGEGGKVEWCEQLARRLNEGRGEEEGEGERVRVVCVKKVKT
ncbi:hypothetical protein QBC35DRAFT_374983 [Podospora australis]|uniref:Uncharacterized protein n=1 Tax=Podospora australis TaxID=1536484 RepID=A0AAN6X0Z3_9PEZI|nr:hypothetical protein QBC35DRAFT_374983 [Podospora australis]